MVTFGWIRNAQTENDSNLRDDADKKQTFCCKSATRIMKTAGFYSFPYGDKIKNSHNQDFWKKSNYKNNEFRVKTLMQYSFNLYKSADKKEL